jgi:3-methyladenine DNA glycosylase AlkD
MQPLTSAVVGALAPLVDPAKAVPMAAYMKGHFPFLGIPRPTLDPSIKPLLHAWKPTNQHEVDVVIDELWSLPEREYQYVAARAVVRLAKVVPEADGPAMLELLLRCVASRTWWDTVDELAIAVGSVTQRSPQTVGPMMALLDHDNFWMARIAILHQRRFGPSVDLDRLAACCLHRADDKEFFIRKAIGWALREASYDHPDWVRRFVADHPQLSNLSRAEALKALRRRERPSGDRRDRS